MRRRVVTAFFALALLGLAAIAQPAGGRVVATPTAAAISAVTEEPLILFSRPVFTFRASLMGISARDRAKRAHTRIHDQLNLAGPHAVTLKAEDTVVQVQIDGATSFVVLAADLDPGSEVTLEQTAQHAAQALTHAISESAESRSLETLTRALLQALAGSALYAGLVWLLARGHRLLAGRLVEVAERHSAKLRVGGMALWQRGRIADTVRLVLVLVYRLLVFVLSVEWLSFVLRSFPFTRGWGESLNSFLLNLAMPVDADRKLTHL